MENRIWLKGDTHLHTCNSDGKLTPGQLVEACQQAGLDYAIITDHNYNTVKASYTDKNLLVMQGQEITDDLGHINVWGKKVPQDPPYILKTVEDYDAVLQVIQDDAGILLAALSPEEVLAFLDEEISNMDDEALSVPVGSLLFPTFFAGRGFSIPVRVLALNSTNADFYSQIQSLGINQSVQQIRITFTVSLSFLTPAGIQDTDVTSDVLAAQTILLGDVPESYLYLG